jgi:AcrR family transcriptional regulator
MIRFVDVSGSTHHGGGMTLPAPPSLRERNRLAARDAILDAAERLLERGEAAEFSMRELAVEAGKGFVTPFNHFGSKGAIMQALSGRVIDRMEARFREEAPGGDALERTLAMGRIAAACLLERPAVYKAVVGSLGTVGPMPSEVRPRSRALWELALGDLEGISADLHGRARAILADQVAFAFRGCVSFWIAGDVADDRLCATVETVTATALLGFAAPSRRERVLTAMAFHDDPGQA